MTPRKIPRIKTTEEAITAAANDEESCKCRYELAKYSSKQFIAAAVELVRSDDDAETTAISVLLRIGGELIWSSAALIGFGRPYAAAALVRQLVEVEYLAWAFEINNRDAERWLKSTQKERQEFFKPAKLRKAAKGKFRGKDYGYHCEMGGHPTPQGTIFLGGNNAASQLFLSDMLGHVRRIWDHLVGWAMKSDNGQPILKRGRDMSVRFSEWKARDILVDLPPPE